MEPASAPPLPPYADATATPGALTVQLPVRPDAEQALGAYLRAHPFPFARIGAVHYARWAILPRGEDGAGYPVPATLLLAVNHDGATDGWLAAAVDEAAEALDARLAFCEGYPPPPERTPARRLAYLQAHALPHDVFYVGAHRRTLAQILHEARLHAAIQDFVDGRDWRGTEPAEVRRAIQHYVFEERGDAFAWARTPPPPPVNRLRCFARRFWWVLVGAGFALAIVLAVLFTRLALGWLLVPAVIAGLPLVAALAALLVVRVKEARENWAFRTDPVLPYRRADDYPERPDPRQPQTPLTHVAAVRPGRIRHATLRFVLWGVEAMCRCRYTRGMIAGIRTIHFARWVRVDGGRRLIFLSNFDGSWINYLAETSDDLAAGPLTALWSNTEGFPPTRWLFHDGARDVDRFAAWTAAGEALTQDWYCAYPALSLFNIDNNTALRHGLSPEVDLDDDGLRLWLRRI
ncbi:MAG: hypothetical protein R3247_02575 [Rhodothermales bacterium]|nr:hypothetical protein [Rhodothermales bacterium]